MFVLVQSIWALDCVGEANEEDDKEAEEAYDDSEFGGMPKQAITAIQKARQNAEKKLNNLASQEAKKQKQLHKAPHCTDYEITYLIYEYDVLKTCLEVIEKKHTYWDIGKDGKVKGK